MTLVSSLILLLLLPHRPYLLSPYMHYEDEALILQHLHNILPENTIAVDDHTATSKMGHEIGNTSAEKKGFNKDRHNKINTAHGPRDRRMRLSLDVALKFFHLQDMLGFDKASKTIEWLLIKSWSAINELPQMKNTTCVFGANSASSTSECEVVSRMKEFSNTTTNNNNNNQTRGANATKKKKIKAAKRFPYHYHPVLARESREKARERARERTKEKMRNLQLICESKTLELGDGSGGSSSSVESNHSGHVKKPCYDNEIMVAADQLQVEEPTTHPHHVNNSNDSIYHFQLPSII